MRKLITVLLSLCIFASLALCVSADVIWMPYEDTFFDTYRDKIIREDRTYVSPVVLSFVVSPEDNSKTDYDPIPADEPFNVNFTYVDEGGVLWGLVYIEMGNGAWVDLRGCSRPYDRTDFTKAHEDEFAPIVKQPNVNFYDNEVFLYDYPGAEEALDTLHVNIFDAALPEFEHTYTDEAGNVWAELYYYMQQDGWVLLEGDISTAVKPEEATDYVVGEISEKVTYAPYVPSDDPVETDNPEELTDISEADTATQEVSVDAATTAADLQETKPETNNKILPALLVGAVVAVTAVVLFVFFRKKKN